MSELAKELIALNKIDKDCRLDLGNTGLLSLPTELFDCVWLTELIISSTWLNDDNSRWVTSKNGGKKNSLASIPNRISRLTQLKILRIGAKSDDPISETNFDCLKQLSNLEILDLSFNSIKNLSFLKDLSKLESLNLMHTKRSNLDFVSFLPKLQSLNISFNVILNYDGLKNASQLEKLNISETKIIDLAFIHRIHCLRELDVSNNYVTFLTPLTGLKFLKYLNIAYNKIRDLSPLQHITTLETLNITANKVSDIDCLQYLTGLRQLYMGVNSIRSLNPVQNLRHLHTLHAQSTLIDKIDSLQLLSVEQLVLDANPIADYSFISDLVKLKILSIRSSRIDDIRQLLPMAELSNLEVVNLEGNSVLAQIPYEVIKSGWSAIQERLLAIAANEDFVIIKELKVLLLGNTNVGKSNLLEYFDTGKEPVHDRSTHGVQYKRLRSTFHEFILNCWDFGGQDFFHATHQLFFSPGALNIVLWSKQDIVRENGEECYDLSYWFRSIEQINNNFYSSVKRTKNKVIVCENKIDLQQFKQEAINQPLYKESFPDLEFTFTHLNLKPLKNDLSFKDQLRDDALQLLTLHPRTYKNYLNRIHSHPSSYLPVADLSSETEKIKTALQVFHNMGLLLYFPTIIPDKIFNKPEVLLDVLYNRILSNDRKFKKTDQEIEQAIQDNELDLTPSQALSLLKHFDLIFQIPKDPAVHYIPQYLPPLKQNSFLRRQFGEYNIKIESDNYLLNLAMLKIYSNYGKFAEEEQNEYLFWHDGIIIEKNEMMLMIVFDRKEHAILLYPSRVASNFELQIEVIQFIFDLPNQDRDNRMDVLNVISPPSPNIVEVIEKNDFFQVFVSRDSERFINWKKLIHYKKIDFRQIDVLNFKTRQWTSDHMRHYEQFVPFAEEVAKKSIMICYCETDETWKSELIKHLSPLYAQDVIKTYFFNCIGKEKFAHENTLNEIGQTDIFLLLITPDLLGLGEIFRAQIEPVYERSERGQAQIIPVICDSCKWELFPITNKVRQFNPVTNKVMNVWLGKFTSLPVNRLPIANWGNRNEGFLDVVNELEKFL